MQSSRCCYSRRVVSSWKLNTTKKTKSRAHLATFESIRYLFTSSLYNEHGGKQNRSMHRIKMLGPLHLVFIVGQRLGSLTHALHSFIRAADETQCEEKRSIHLRSCVCTRRKWFNDVRSATRSLHYQRRKPACLLFADKPREKKRLWIIGLVNYGPRTFVFVKYTLPRDY